MKKICLMILWIAAICIPATGESIAGQEIRVAFGSALPPYVIPETHNGIAADIIKAALEPAGFAIKPLYYPYARRLVAYKAGDADAVCDISENIINADHLEGYFSDIAYEYENIGVSLKKNGYRFSGISDLRDYSVVAWQGAKAAIGREYAAMAEKNKRYTEVADQKRQVKVLFLGRADVIQLDRLIFQYYRNEIAKEGIIDVSQPVDIFPLFGKNRCGFLFKDRAVRDAFNRNLAAIRKSGEYEQIVQSYF